MRDHRLHTQGSASNLHDSAVVISKLVPGASGVATHFARSENRRWCAKAVRQGLFSGARARGKGWGGGVPFTKAYVGENLLEQVVIERVDQTPASCQPLESHTGSIGLEVQREAVSVYLRSMAQSAA